MNRIHPFSISFEENVLRDDMKIKRNSGEVGGSFCDWSDCPDVASEPSASISIYFFSNSISRLFQKSFVIFFSLFSPVSKFLLQFLLQALLFTIPIAGMRLPGHRSSPHLSPTPLCGRACPDGIVFGRVFVGIILGSNKRPNKNGTCQNNNEKHYIRFVSDLYHFEVKTNLRNGFLRLVFSALATNMKKTTPQVHFGILGREDCPLKGPEEACKFFSEREWISFGFCCQDL